VSSFNNGPTNAMTTSWPAASNPVINRRSRRWRLRPTACHVAKLPQPEANQNPDSPNRDIEPERQFRQHSCRQQDAETNDEVAKRQGQYEDVFTEHARCPD
jgi:Mg-chelatase subunit ChlI